MSQLVPASVVQWFCHCCSAKNPEGLHKCRVCGRPENYAQGGYQLPFHGKNALLFRPSQIINVVEDIHEADSEKWTALHAACASGNFDTTKKLLEYKSQIEALTSKGHTPLHLAVYGGSHDCVAILLKAKAEINVRTFYESMTPLHVAAERGLARICQTLISHGADIHAENILKRTPLHCCATIGRTDIARLLLRSGAKLNAKDAHEWEACQIAEFYNHRDLQEMLIREGMTEKQAVIKELPPAPWHSDIWSQVVKTHTMRKIEYNNISRTNDEEAARIQKMKDDITYHRKEQERTDRRIELAEYRAKQQRLQEAYNVYKIKK